MRIAFTHNLQTDHDDETQAEFDRQETVDAICDALRALGHDVTAVDVGGPPQRLIERLTAARPDLVFNTAEGSHGRFREAFYPALFDQLGLPFTGSDAWVCALTLDKQLSKLMVREAGVPTPRWLFIEDERHLPLLDQVGSNDFQFPVIVKPNFEGSSKGITPESVVEDAASLRARVQSELPKYPTGLLVEEFIGGRDVVVPFLEAASPATGGVLLPVSYRFDASIIGERKHVIYDYTLKCLHSEAVEVEAPAPIGDEVTARVRALSQQAFRALGVRDLGRIDWRVDDAGRISFLEVNALPSLEPGAGIYLAGALSGLTRTEDVLGAVVESAAKRQNLSSGKTTVTTLGASTRLRVGFTYNQKRKAARSAADDDSEAEYDSERTLDAIRGALTTLGHDVVNLEATPDLPRRFDPASVDVVFNMAEGAHGRAREAQVPALLEMCGVEYSGSDTATMATALDKALCKTVVAAHGVPVASSFVWKSGDEPLPTGVTFPVIAKPNTEGSSKGVVQKCVATDEAALRATVRELASRYHQEILVEAFLPGREFTIALLADAQDGSKPRVLPPMEIVYLDKANAHPIYAFEDKLDWSKTIRYDRPAVVDDALRAEIESVAVAAWRALGCRDVARVDVRQDAAGRVCFIEVNTLPGLSPGWSDLCLISEAAGIDYTALIGAILAPALERFRRTKAAHLR